MKRWLQRARGALGMGVVWAIGGLGIGGLIELLDNVLPGGFAPASAVDMWPLLLAMVGFIGGVIFGTVLGVAGARRRFDELSLPGFAALGAVSGVLLGLYGMTQGAPLLFVGVATVLSTGAATGSLLLARKAQDRALGGGVEDAGAMTRGKKSQKLSGGER